MQGKLVKNIKGLAEFVKDLRKDVKDLKSVALADGRRINVGSDHKSLNYNSQGNNAVAMKYFLVNLHRKLMAKDYKWGEHFVIMSVIYDEVNLRVRDDCVEEVSKILREGYAIISRQLNMSTTFTGEVMVGKSWWEVH